MCRLCTSIENSRTELAGLPYWRPLLLQKELIRKEKELKMALPTSEDHNTDQAEQLTLLSPEELTDLRRSVASQPPPKKTASSEVRGICEPRGPKDSPVQDELPFP
jgi:hypothetical protein